MTIARPRRRPVAPVAVAALAGVALALAAALDGTLAAKAAGAPRTLVEVGRFVTSFGTSEYMFAFSALIGAVAVVALGRGHAAWHGGSLRVIAERSLYFFAAIAASGLVDQALKHAIGRARPRLLRLDGPFHFEPLSAADVFASFPSGHTTSAFAAAVALSLMRPDWRGRLIGAALLIGASRVLVGAHYPSDVVGGAALGAASSLALARVFARRGLAFVLVDGGAVIKPLRPAGRRPTP
ncbi:phosphatase PAP2 family protein [Lichenibacterium dinghuense]|uniref:phosphatase PAP2 family protein n=1 Tax=Lichenibacterium dinghuense TaxID=2895977 RepID=UPI001F34B91E|nr:phosphatase PAP2 family protein [Lichenibacterium sp. 6Y81]